jgi:hypothetical protein
MAVFNFGCCGSGGCGVSYNKDSSDKKIKDVEFEEVVDEK